MRLFPTVGVHFQDWNSGQQSGNSPQESPALPAGLFSTRAALPEACLLWLVADCGFGVRIYIHKGFSEKKEFLVCW